MLVIRLQRVGKRNAASFRVVLAEKSKPIKGKFIEILGFYNPKTKEKQFESERITYWISKGAGVSPTVHNMLVSEKIIEGEKVKAWRPKKKKGKEGGELEKKPEGAKEETEQKPEEGKESGSAEATPDKPASSEATTDEEKKEEKPAADENKDEPKEEKEPKPAEAEKKEPVSAESDSATPDKDK